MSVRLTVALDIETSSLKVLAYLSNLDCIPILLDGDGITPAIFAYRDNVLTMGNSVQRLMGESQTFDGLFDNNVILDRFKAGISGPKYASSQLHQDDRHRHRQQVHDLSRTDGDILQDLLQHIGQCALDQASAYASPADVSLSQTHVRLLVAKPRCWPGEYGQALTRCALAVGFSSCVVLSEGTCAAASNLEGALLGPCYDPESYKLSEVRCMMFQRFHSQLPSSGIFQLITCAS